MLSRRIFPTITFTTFERRFSLPAAALRLTVAMAALFFQSGASQTVDEIIGQREAMVKDQIRARGVRNERVIEAMRQVPRHLFVPPELRAHAYEDKPLGIGEGQTISQPYMVALMSELARLDPADTVLEIGTGSGYQAAVLARLARRVYSIEIVPTLAAAAKERLRTMGIDNVEVRTGDGYKGWPEQAPFAAILVTAAPPEIPTALLQQLSRGGRMVVPVGKAGKTQNLLLLEKSKTSEEIVGRTVIPVRFVPMVPGNPAEPLPE
jgi:protein-L-isoaspartate(D-aspartate) O-methyltransferase